VEGTLLRMLVQLSGARRVLEIDTYIHRLRCAGTHECRGHRDAQERPRRSAWPRGCRMPASSSPATSIRKQPGSHNRSGHVVRMVARSNRPSDRRWRPLTRCQRKCGSTSYSSTPTMCMDAQVPRSAGMCEGGQGKLPALL
jgi:hypothetical protein